MAKLIIGILLAIIFSSLILNSSSSISLINPTQKLTTFQVYTHTSGDNSSLVTVAEATSTNSSSTSFGLVRVGDFLVTHGPDLNSTHLGRAQGINAYVSTTEPVLLMVMSFVFTQGKYNGSTLSVLGRNPFATETVREMPVNGGTGKFRFATGYALQTMYTGTTEEDDHVYEYNFYVRHY